jgi:hypothetical protein
MPAGSGKDLTMWVFDGEEWMEEGGAANERKHEMSLPIWDETMPELQVIEHLPPARPVKGDVPPLPMP